MEFWKSKEWQELSGLLTTAYLPGPTIGGQYLSLLSARTPDGKMVLAAAVFDDIYPGSSFIEITDEELLAKLRNIKGQFHNISGTGDLPVFYYEYLMSTADFKVFSKTGKTPIVTEKERPEKIRLTEGIVELLIKRQTSLADALDALTTVMLNALGAKYGERDQFSRFSEQVSRFPGSTERDRAVGLIPRPGGLAAKVQPRTVTMVEERPERVRRLAIEVSEVMAKRGPSLADGFDALSSTMLTAIEATCGRERADEFDLLMAGFSKEVISGGRVQSNNLSQSKIQNLRVSPRWKAWLRALLKL
jgi:hypothetical protein